MKNETAKLPRGFKLIGRTSKAVLRATMDAANRTDAMAAAPHRHHYGRNSPLDRLPHAVKSELRKRCKDGERFREIRDWLMKRHGQRTSVTSLSQWWIRQQEAAGNSATAATKGVRGGALEFIVHAPGASEVRVLVKPL